MDAARINKLHEEIHERLQEFGGLTGSPPGHNTIDWFNYAEAKRVRLSLKQGRAVTMAEVFDD